MSWQSSVREVNGQLYSIPSRYCDVPLSRGAPTNRLQNKTENRHDLLITARFDYEILHQMYKTALVLNVVTISTTYFHGSLENSREEINNRLDL